MALIWRSLLTICVSILGLVSCTQEKGEEDKGKKDDWRLSPPVIVAGTEVVVTNAAFNSKLTPLPASGELAFPSLADGKAKNVKLEVTSTCQAGSRTDTQFLKVQNVDRIPLRSLVPIRFLSSFASQAQSNANEVICNVDVTARNALGSRHHFRVNDLKISGIETTHNLAVFDGSSQPSTPPEALTSGRQGQVHLYCEKFENLRPLGKSPWRDTLRELVEGPKVDDTTDGSNGPASDGNDDKNASASTPSVDPRVEQVRQKCQLIVEAIAPETGLVERWISAPSAVRFPAPQVKIEGSLTLSGVFPTALKDFKLFEAKIANPYSIPLHLSIPLLPRPTFSLQFFHFMQEYNYTVRSVTATVPIEFKIEGNNEGVIEGGALHFVLAPHAEVTVTARPFSVLPCDGKSEWVFDNPNNIGFAYGFSNIPRLRLKSRGLEGQLSEEDAIAWPFTFVEGNDLKLDGWQFYPTWLHNHPDAKQLPTPSPGADMPLCS